MSRFGIYRHNKEIFWTFVLITMLMTLFIARDIPILRAMTAQGVVEVTKDIAYVKNSGNPEQKLDVYAPKGVKNFPVVVFFHGGFWRSGDKNYYQPFTGLYANIGIALARRGIGTVIPNYRLNPETTIDGQMDDVVRVTAWTAANIGSYGGDPSRIFLMGHSAGGHLISLLGADPEWFRGAGLSSRIVKGSIALSAIFDLNALEQAGDRTFNETILYPNFGRDAASLRRYSPITYAGKGLPAFLFLVGDRDLPYILPQYEAMIEKIRGAGGTAEYFVMPDKTHTKMVSDFGNDDDPVMNRVVDFVSHAP